MNTTIPLRRWDVTARTIGRIAVGASNVVERLLPAGSRRRWWFLATGSGLGWGLAIGSILIMARIDGGLGYDAHAYWLAGRHVLDGVPLYRPVGIAEYGAYFYPPVFAQLIAPFSLLPEAAFTWLLRLVLLFCLRYIAGSWIAVGWWFLFPLLGFPTINELVVGGVVFPVAALTLASLRGREALAPWAAALHIGPLVVLPFLWARRNRRMLVVGIASLALACLASVLLNPGDWAGYFTILTQQAPSSTLPPGLIRFLPTTLSDFAARAFVALAIVFVAVRRNAGWLAFVAHVIAAPTLWSTRLVPLLATPRLALHDEREPAKRPRGEGEPTHDV